MRPLHSRPGHLSRSRADAAGEDCADGRAQHWTAAGVHPPRVGTPLVVGSRRPRAQVRRCKLICWDLGGQAALRAIWEKYYSEAHGLIYVVDAADTERIDESRNVRAPPAASPAPPPASRRCRPAQPPLSPGGAGAPRAARPP